MACKSVAATGNSVQHIPSYKQKQNVLTVQIRLVQTNIESGPPLWEKYRWNSSTIQDAQWTFGCNCWGHESQLHTIVKSQKTTLSSSSSGCYFSHVTIKKLFLLMSCNSGVKRYLATFFGGSVLVETETDSRPLASGSFGGSVMELFRPSKAWRQTNHQHETQTEHHLEVYTSSWGLLTGQIRVHLGIYGGLGFQSSICMQPFDRNLCLTETPRTPNPDSKSARNRSGRKPVVAFSLAHRNKSRSTFV